MIAKKFVYLMAAVLLLIPASGDAYAVTFPDPPILMQKTTPLANEDFGISVDMDNGQIVVGATNDMTGGDDFGAAYLFDATNGNLLQTFAYPGTEDGTDFGISVAISGNLVLVGAERETVSSLNDAGTAYLFDATTGLVLQTFNEITPQASHRFGSSVDVNGTHVLIGASHATVSSIDSGVAYLFDLSGNQVAQYNHPAGTGADRFGDSVAFSGDNVLIGSWQTDGGATNTGAAYVFDTNSGSFVRSFTLASPTGFERFGTAVALDGINGAIGAPDESPSGGGDGVAYVYDVDTGAQLQRIEDPTTSSSGNFGLTIAVDANNVLVGDSSANEAYLFDITTGSLIHTFTAPNLGSFSSGVTLEGDNVVIGAQDDNTGATGAGAAYLYLGVPDSSGSSQTQGQVDIAGTCGISFVSGTPINYGSLVPDDTSAEQVMNIQNTGTITADLLVSGNDWVDSVPTSVITVDNTRYAETSGTYASKTSLTTTPTIISGISFDPSVSIPLYWQLLADLINPTFVGSLTQEMTFSASC